VAKRKSAESNREPASRTTKRTQRKQHNPAAEEHSGLLDYDDFENEEPVIERRTLHNRKDNKNNYSSMAPNTMEPLPSDPRTLIMQQECFEELRSERNILSSQKDVAPASVSNLDILRCGF
jgi:hypothetical protein